MIRFIPAFSGFQGALRRGDNSAALEHFEAVLRSFEGRPPPAYMGFYAQLLLINGRPRVDALAIFNRVANGEFSEGRDNAEAQYAVAHSRYVLAYLTKQAETVARWAEARALKPKRGFSSNRLVLPNDPLILPITF
jgi:hypothetical protein